MPNDTNTFVPAPPANAPALVMESDFAYEPPAYIDESGEARKLADAAIADIVNEYQGDQSEAWLADNPESTEDAAAGEETQPEDAEGEPRKAEPAADEDELLDPKTARTFERVVQRELAAKEREAAAFAREASVEAKLKELRGLEGKKSTKELELLLDNDPIGAIKALGKDPHTVIRLALAQEILEKGPPDDPAQLKTYNELKEFSKGYEQNRKIAALEAKLEAKERASESQNYFNTVASGAREYVKTLGAGTPTFTKLQKADAEQAYNEVMEEITRDAQTRMASDPGGEPMSYEKAAANVEARLSKYAKLLGLNSTLPANPKAKPIIPPQSKPPARPLKPWETAQDDIYERGIKEALREFHTSEAAAKQRR